MIRLRTEQMGITALDRTSSLSWVCLGRHASVTMSPLGRFPVQGRWKSCVPSPLLLLSRVTFVYPNWIRSCSRADLNVSRADEYETRYLIRASVVYQLDIVKCDIGTGRPEDETYSNDCPRGSPLSISWRISIDNKMRFMQSWTSYIFLAIQSARQYSTGIGRHSVDTSSIDAVVHESSMRYIYILFRCPPVLVLMLDSLFQSRSKLYFENYTVYTDLL